MDNYSLTSTSRINQARTHFIEHGILPAGLVSDPIMRSWKRSIENGVGRRPPAPILTPKEFDRLTQKYRDFLTQSVPVMENLYEQVQNTSSMVVLADASGVILHAIGDPNFMVKAKKIALRPGGIWSEHYRGTNAIGTALMEQHPVVVHCSEHYDSCNDFLTCAASPIFDPHGRLLGVLNISGDSRAYQQHTMPLVRISVQQIENQMFSFGFESDITIRFHRRPECIGTMYEAIIVFTPEGKLRAANRSALLHLGLDRHDSRTTGFEQLFNMRLEAILPHVSDGLCPVHQLQLCNGLEVFGRVMWQPTHISSRYSHEVRPHQTMKCSPQKTGEQITTVGALEYGDTKMRDAIKKARKIAGHDIPVLIEGESGTGKELFAKAVHNSGPRRNGPFVALNCAAIPESLIESELFGYREGAFTGARRKGSIGKIQQADGGTLFLDEIGDMPLSLQARLLRVLQERTVTPLGGSASLNIDINIVCATNRKLRIEIAAGRFREDLYYRLNGMLVTLPKLREREDLLALAHAILDGITGPHRRVTLHDSVIRMFTTHPWPGNIRQMHNVLRTAVALLDDTDEINASHMPDDFLEQLQDYQSLSEDNHSTRQDHDSIDEERLELLESRAIHRAIAECSGNVSAAARRLGISRNTLYRKMRSYGL